MCQSPPTEHKPTFWHRRLRNSHSKGVLAGQDRWSTSKLQILSRKHSLPKPPPLRPPSPTEQKTFAQIYGIPTPVQPFQPPKLKLRPNLIDVLAPRPKTQKKKPPRCPPEPQHHYLTQQPSKEQLHVSSSLFFEDVGDEDCTSLSKQEYEQIVKPRFLFENQ